MKDKNKIIDDWAIEVECDLLLSDNILPMFYNKVMKLKERLK